MATIIATQAAQSDLVQYAILGGGAFLIYTFWDELKTLFETLFLAQK